MQTYNKIHWETNQLPLLLFLKTSPCSLRAIQENFNQKVLQALPCTINLKENFTHL